MRIFICLAAAAALFFASFSDSRSGPGVYRCVLDNGHISYQQISCGGESQAVEIRDRRTGWSALRPGEKELLKSYRSKDAQRRRKPSGQAKKTSGESRDCWNRRKKLDAIKSRLRRGYKLKESDTLHRQRDNYEDYLRRFCS